MTSFVAPCIVFETMSRLCVLQEDDVIGLLNSADISDLKPLGDRVLIEVIRHDMQILST